MPLQGFIIIVEAKTFNRICKVWMIMRFEQEREFKTSLIYSSSLQLKNKFGIWFKVVQTSFNIFKRPRNNKKDWHYNTLSFNSNVLVSYQTPNNAEKY